MEKYGRTPARIKGKVNESYEKRPNFICVLCGSSFFAAAGLTGCARKTDVIFEEELSDSGTERYKNRDCCKTPAENPSAPEPSQTPVPEPQPIFVDVCGAVSEPGVIELPAGSRVFEAIRGCGRLSAGSGCRICESGAASHRQGSRCTFPQRRRPKGAASCEE